MIMKKKEEDKILDVNASMQGSLVFSDPVNLRINGKFEGNLTTKGMLIIGGNAQVRADISGEEIVISGMVRGNIKASKGVRLTSTAEVFADIDTPKLSIEDGAFFNGKSKMPQGKMSILELSDYLSVGEEKIMEWVDTGKIPVDREGEKLVFDRKEVEVWISHNS